MDVNEIFIGLINDKNNDNMAIWFYDNNALFSDEDKMIYNNSLFNGTSLNRIVGDKNTHQ